MNVTKKKKSPTNKINHTGAKSFVHSFHKCNVLKPYINILVIYPWIKNTFHMIEVTDLLSLSFK